MAPENRRRWSRWSCQWASCPGLCCLGRCPSGGHTLSASTKAQTNEDLCGEKYLRYTLKYERDKNLNRYVSYVLWLTCKQSSEVMTMRGHLDWHASSKGKKYLSASIKFVFDLIGGRVLELDLPSPLGGLGKNKWKIMWDEHSHHTVRSSKEAALPNQPGTHALSSTSRHV